MAIPPKYLNTEEAAIASFDIQDVITGTVYSTLNCGSVNGVIMRPFVFDSDSEETFTRSSITGIEAIPFKGIDLDFDIDIGQTLVIQGNALVSATLSVRNEAGAMNSEHFITVVIKKGDTPIVSASSAIQLINGVGATKVERKVGVAFVIPKTTFKKGETLRLTIEVWSTTNVNGAQIYIGHDPLNKTIEVQKIEDTILQLFLPFNPDL